MKRITTYILVVIGILILVNVLSDNFFLRLDLTADNRYTLSRATKNILRNLKEPVTVTAYFTKDPPTQMVKTKRDFNEMLVEYHNISKGMVVYEFLNPSENEEEEQKAMSAGIQPVIANVREKNQAKQQKVYMGAVVAIREDTEVIPFMQPGAAMEYALSSAIKKISVQDKPVIGLLQGHGEASIQAIPQALSALSVLYEIEPIVQNDSVNELLAYPTVAMIAPKDSIPAIHLDQLDEYLANGGNLFLALNRVEGDLNNARGFSVNTGMETWLTSKGLIMQNNFVVDANCMSINVRQQQGNFTFSSSVMFPYIPVLSKFAEHPITSGLESVVMPFISTISYTGDTTKTFVPLVMTGDMSGSQPSPTYFDVSKRWTEADFPMKALAVAGVLSGNLVGNQSSNIVLVADGDFPVNGEGQNARQQSPDNISLMVNSIDYLSDDTGLIELRTKGITNRPLEQIEDGRKAFLKWFNFILPILLVIIYGVFRLQFNRSLRMKRMEKGYV